MVEPFSEMHILPKIQDIVMNFIIVQSWIQINAYQLVWTGIYRLNSQPVHKRSETTRFCPKLYLYPRKRILIVISYFNCWYA